MKTITVTYSALQEILLESSIGDLERNTIAAFPDTKGRQNATIPVTVMDMTILPGQKTIQCKATTRNTNSNSTYQTQILFQDVRYAQEGDTQQTVSFQSSDGEEYNIVPLEKTRTQVQVACSCLDFYWTFAAYNSSDGSLIGPAPEPYTSAPNAAPRNPNHSPGLCKHLMALGSELQSQNLMR